jgi:hypothetical protein
MATTTQPCFRLAILAEFKSEPPGKFFWSAVIPVRRCPMRIDSGRSCPNISIVLVLFKQIHLVKHLKKINNFLLGKLRQFYQHFFIALIRKTGLVSQ